VPRRVRTVLPTRPCCDNVGSRRLFPRLLPPPWPALASITRFLFPVLILCHRTYAAWRAAGRAVATSFSGRKRPADASVRLSPPRRAPVGNPVSRPRRPFANQSRFAAACCRRRGSRARGKRGLTDLQLAPVDASGDCSLFSNAKPMGSFRGLSVQGSTDSPTPSPSGIGGSSVLALPKPRRPRNVWPFRPFFTTSFSCGSGQIVTRLLALWTKRRSPLSRGPIHLSSFPTSLHPLRLSPLALSRCAALVPQQDGSRFCQAKTMSIETVRLRL